MAKIKHQERLSILQREYHRRKQWKISHHGLFVPHSYEGSARPLTFWDDVGFILNRRRVLVVFQHPRNFYLEKTYEIARQMVGTPPASAWVSGESEVQWEKVGNSRKKVKSRRLDLPSPESSAYMDRLTEMEKRLQQDGIDFAVPVSIRRTRLPWSTMVEIVVPMEVRNVKQLSEVADLTKQILKGQTTLKNEFGEYRYTREDWLRDYAELKKLEATS